MIEFGTDPRVEIHCDPGFYSFTDGTSGKTYLAKLIAQAAEQGLPYVTYSYYDYVRGVDLAAVCEKVQAELVFVDRYDMFSDDTNIQAQIQNLAQDIVVLADLKSSNPPIMPDDYLVLTRSAELLEVT